MPRPRLLSLLLLSILVSAGCTHVISSQGRDKVDRETGFDQVQVNPERYMGKTLLLGGVIVDMQFARGVSTLEVFRWKLDRWGEPVAVDEDAGRFLARTERLLDPVLYAPGRLITLTGTLIGQETLPLRQLEYRYPLFRIDESYLWETPFRYGIHRHPNIYVPYYVGPERPGRTSPYDPGYYAYPYTPYWLRSLAR